MKRRMTEYLLFPFILLVISCMLAESAMFSQAAFAALKLCATTLIPVLFPFSVLSGFLIFSGAADRIFLPWAKLPARLLGCEEQAVCAVFLGMLCGYPIGAVTLAALYHSGAVSKSTAERLPACCTNASPVFLIAVVGSRLLHSAKAGVMLLLIHILAAVLTGILMRTKNVHHCTDRQNTSAMHPAAAFTKAVQSGGMTMISVSGFVVIFSVICRMVCRILPRQPVISAVLCGLMELTNGLYVLSEAALDPRIKFLFFAVLTGFSGFCVHFQVLSCLLPEGISGTTYLKGKLIHAVISLLLAVPFSMTLTEIPAAAAAFSSPVPVSDFLLTAVWAIFSFAMFFTFLWKFADRCAIIKKR